ncbi:MAG: PQQ-binding-like beta-propeller repeat protein, partial [Phycisphaerae bacterium]
EGADKREEASFGKRRGERPPRPAHKVVAVDLRTGKELWSVGADVLGRDDVLYLDAAGSGAVAVSHDNGLKTSVLSAKDGALRFQVKRNAYAAFFEGEVHIGPAKHDPRTGKETGPSPLDFRRTICTPSYYVNGILVRNRGGGYVDHGKNVQHGAFRGGCLFSSPAANGALYSPQNWCRCSPGQIEGFVSFGPVGQVPTEEEMVAAPVIEKGPAFGKPSGAVGENDWPMYRHDAGRSNATPSTAPQRLDVLWQKKLVVPAGEGPVAATWSDLLIDPLTAPVVAEGLMVAAASDRHQVIALDAASGKEAWRHTVGGRIDTSPTIHDGACLFGSHDGYVYSLSCKDGRLAWKMRAAPKENRMVSYGQVESPWPVIGTVLVAGGTAYASAGRTMGSDGGIAIRAFDPATAKIVWSRAIAGAARGATRRNDLMLSDGEAIQLMAVRMDPRSGEAVEKPKAPAVKAGRKPAAKDKVPSPKDAGAPVGAIKPPAVKVVAELTGKPKTPAAKVAAKPPAQAGPVTPTCGLEGFICWHWTRLGDRRSGQMALGSVKGNMLSWDERLVCCNLRGTSIKAFDRAGAGPGKSPPKSQKWAVNMPNELQANCIVVCRDAVVGGGGIYGSGETARRGFVWVLSSDKGEKTAELTLQAPLAYNGIAVAGGRIYATLADGSAVCLGQR